MQPLNPFNTTEVTFINPLGLIFTLLMGILMIVLPRRYALLPLMALTCYMTMGMRFVVGTLNFTMFRVILLFGVARLVLRGELNGIKFNHIDRALLIWVVVNMTAYNILWQSTDAFKYKLGFAYDTIGWYFLFRFLIRSESEIVRNIKMYAVMILPLAGAMVMEKLTGRNSFSAFGGVPFITQVRDGSLRCQGPFAHPILAGTFGATLAPLFAGLWWQGRRRLLSIVAVCAGAVIAITSASSGPVLAFMAGMFAMGLWYLRGQMRKIRWGVVAMLISLAMVMKAPVWFIIDRVDVFHSSTGYHRAYLIDRAIANFSNWWLVGTKSTWDWADREAHLFDVTNTYIQNGVDGGILTMILFITIIVLCFKGIGRLVRLGDGREAPDKLRLAWALGAALFAHAATFMSVTYFDQNFINWYLLLAMISMLAGPSLLMPRREFIAQLSEKLAEASPRPVWAVSAPLLRKKTIHNLPAVPVGSRMSLPSPTKTRE